MKALLFVAACLYSITCLGQTKLISFRSHSGNNANFRTAVEADLFDSGSSNFGIIAHPVTKIDTVLLKDANTIIVMRKDYSSYSGDVPIASTKVKYSRQIFTRAKRTDFFKALNVDSLKAKLKMEYQYPQYPTTLARLDSTVFIGFDKIFKQKTAKSNK